MNQKRSDTEALEDDGLPMESINDKLSTVKEEKEISEEKKEDAGEDEDDKECTYYFGFGKWHPKWLQKFANAKFFTFILCINSLVEGALVSGEWLCVCYAFLRLATCSLEHLHQTVPFSSWFRGSL